MEFKAWPSIEQFRNAVKSVQWIAQRTDETDADGNPVMNRFAELPKLLYRFTTKLHGTSSAITLESNNEIGYQSRNLAITPEKDNCGFATYMEAVPVDLLRPFFSFGSEVYIYGEWCGGNIQSGVALNQLPKMFVVFGAVENGVPLSIERMRHIRLTEYRIFNIHDFQTWEVEIDFNNPHEAQAQLVKIVEEVEAECPVGKYFGVSGIGEGIVGKPVSVEKYSEHNTNLWFKVKGTEHSATKVKTLAMPDTEKIANVKKFVEYAVTESRLNQGIDYLKEHDVDVSDQSTGQFIKWIIGDVMKEEQDTMNENGLKDKDCIKAISTAARDWFFKRLE